jgi:hypothetical protein
MRLKIQGGTARYGEPSLCLTCRYATVIRGPGLQDQIVSCGQVGNGMGRIPFPVHSCSGYSDKRHPSLYEMEDIAWVLRSDVRKGQIGFVRARDLKPRERFHFPDDWDRRPVADREGAASTPRGSLG